MLIGLVDLLNKRTNFYVVCVLQKRIKAAEAESKLKQVYIPN